MRLIADDIVSCHVDLLLTRFSRTKLVRSIRRRVVVDLSGCRVRIENITLAPTYVDAAFLFVLLEFVDPKVDLLKAARVGNVCTVQ
jgi:hypothetical protein